MMEVPNSSKLRWQRDALAALNTLLSLDGMPVVSWTIPISGALVGDVDTLTSTPTEQRQVFASWARQLNAKTVPERTDSDGVVHLYGTFRLAVGYGVGGAIRAAIYPPMEVEGGV
ncbi:hypothetical protein ACIQPQ_31360 [Streptomyces sp. NPDC091281]|uniref:hypothetical protein n=1 Tax=Streptomyces sp. NPDC091281 TaxID=3365985 RepID=UPI00380CF5DD